MLLLLIELLRLWSSASAGVKKFKGGAKTGVFEGLDNLLAERSKLISYVLSLTETDEAI